MPEAPVAPAPVTAAPAPAPAAAPSIDIKANPFSAVDTRAKTLPPKPEPKKEEKKIDAPEAKVEDKAPEKPVASKEDRTAKDPKWFREQHEKAQKELSASQQRIADMERRIAEAEAKGKDTTALSERLANLEKENDSLKGELRAAKQEVSPDFKEKWDKPFDQASAFAQQIVEGMEVATAEGASRAAKWDDFVALYHMPINKAAQQARQMFGDDAPLVIQQLTELHKLDYQRSTALAEEKLKWKENSTKEEAQKVQYEKGFQSMRSIAEKHLAENTPEYQDAPGDDAKEARELRQQGYAVFDARPQTIQEAAIKAADIRHKVAAFAPLVRERNLLKEQLKEAQAQIEELRGNGPTKGSKTTSTTGGGEKDWRDELREVVPAGMN